MREVARLILVGLRCGTAVSLLTGRLLESLLFGVRSWDLSILVSVSAVLAGTPFIAS